MLQKVKKKSWNCHELGHFWPLEAAMTPLAQMGSVVFFMCFTPDLSPFVLTSCLCQISRNISAFTCLSVTNYANNPYGNLITESLAHWSYFLLLPVIFFYFLYIFFQFCGDILGFLFCLLAVSCFSRFLELFCVKIPSNY